ncbi:MAG: hypothetical protein RMM53_06100 [Bacteroidia bacterium]|nr:hypothetical protein [Bacteroidia bacterium]
MLVQGFGKKDPPVLLAEDRCGGRMPDVFRFGLKSLRNLLGKTKATLYFYRVKRQIDLARLEKFDDNVI